VTQRSGVVVLDDHFPTKGTGFRIAEFSWMLRHRVVSEVMTTATPLGDLLSEYSAVHPQTYQQVSAYDPDRLDRFELAAMVFLNNAALFLDDLDKHDLPFVLTLYPGGGLNLGEPDAEAKLAQVLTSRLLRHVITTQPMVTAHVRDVCGAAMPITELIGLTVDPLYLGPGPGFRENYFGAGKDRLDIAFVAHRYRPDGADKGFPVFLDAVALLQDAGLPVHGHVVGGHGADDLAPHHSSLNLTFYGVLSTPELRQFFAGIDLIVSATRPDQLAPGSFDGFPTGSCVEAALSGVAVLASDELGQNRLFTDRRDIHIPHATAADVVARIHEMLAEPGGLRRVAQAGLRTARRAYGIDAQLWPRREIIEAVRAALRMG
jgi:glycosyltransferase involved in cell wall biosynthesis